MKKILHVIDSINIGGAEKLLCNTISELPEFSHLIVTLFPSKDTSLLPANAGFVNLHANRITELPLKRGRYLALLKDFKPDIVHSHLYFATLFAKGFTPASIPLVFTQHFEFSKNAEKWYYRVAEKIVSTKRQVGIAVSNEVLKDYLKCTSFKGEIRVIENYTPDKYFVAGERKIYSKSGTLKLVALGNIKLIKNQQFIVEAFKHLRDLDVTCHIYGDGDQRPVLEKKAKEQNVEVYFKGVIQDASTILHDYDMFIMPSLTEGFPLALFEAMANKLPVIVSDIPVFHEVLDDMGHYIALNNPALLRSIIEAYLQNRELLVTEGEKMRALALAKTSKEVYLNKIRLLYNSQINNS